MKIGDGQLITGFAVKSRMPHFTGSLIALRAVPFLVFVLLTAFQGKFGPTSHYWVYVLKTLTGAAMLGLIWREIPEMKWRFSFEALAVGIGIFVLWIGLDPIYPKLGKIEIVWNASATFPETPALAWSLMAVRMVGMTLIVPPLEEVFFRSFLYRYIISKDFLSVPFRTIDLRALLITAGIFGLEHQQWLPGILCGLSYQWLVIRKDRLGDAMMAHAITNFLLGVWIVWKGAWQFW